MNRDTPAKTAGALSGPLGGFLKSIISQEEIENLQQQAISALTWAKNTGELLVNGQQVIANQNSLILENQRRIMEKLGIVDDGYNDNDSAGTGDAE